MFVKPQTWVANSNLIEIREVEPITVNLGRHNISIILIYSSIKLKMVTICKDYILNVNKQQLQTMPQSPHPWFFRRYTMEKFLGRGASASVWEAFRSDNHQRVAVKVGSAGWSPNWSGLNSSNGSVYQFRVLDLFEDGISWNFTECLYLSRMLSMNFSCRKLRRSLIKAKEINDKLTERYGGWWLESPVSNCFFGSII